MKKLILSLTGIAMALGSFAQSDTLYYNLDRFGKVTFESSIKPDSKLDSMALRSGYLRPKSMLPDGYFVEVNGFQVNEKGELYWQRVFYTDLEKNDLFLKLISKGIKDVYVSDNSIAGNISKIEPNYLGMNIPKNSLKSPLVNSTINAALLIEYKEGKYRVTLSNLNFDVEEHNINRVSSVSYYEIVEQYSINQFAVQVGKGGAYLSEKFRKDFSKPINFTLEKLFEIDNKIYLKSW